MARSGRRATNVHANESMLLLTRKSSASSSALLVVGAGSLRDARDSENSLMASRDSPDNGAPVVSISACMWLVWRLVSASRCTNAARRLSAGTWASNLPASADKSLTVAEPSTWGTILHMATRVTITLVTRG